VRSRWLRLIRFQLQGLGAAFGVQAALRSEWLSDLPHSNPAWRWLLQPESGIALAALPLLAWLLARWGVTSWRELAGRPALRSLHAIGLCVQAYLLWRSLGLARYYFLPEAFTWLLALTTLAAVLHACIRPISSRRHRALWIVGFLGLASAQAWAMIPRAHYFLILTEDGQRAALEWNRQDFTLQQELNDRSYAWQSQEFVSFLAETELPDTVRCALEAELSGVWVREEGHFDDVRDWFAAQLDATPNRCAISRRLILADMIVNERPEKAIVLTQEAVDSWRQGQPWDYASGRRYCDLGDELNQMGHPDLAFHLWTHGHALGRGCSVGDSAYLSQTQLWTTWWRAVLSARMP